MIIAHVATTFTVKLGHDKIADAGAVAMYAFVSQRTYKWLMVILLVVIMLNHQYL